MNMTNKNRNNLLRFFLLGLGIISTFLLSRTQAFQVTSLPTSRLAHDQPNRLYTKDQRQYQQQRNNNVQLHAFLGDFFKRFTTKATASHILIKGGAEAEFKLQDLKTEIGDSPIKFAEAASTFSECPSASQGGSLGEFGPGAMVKEFDTVVFNEEIGKVHGPVRTQFGYHLIYINDRTE